MIKNTKSRKFRTWIKKYFEELLIAVGCALILVGTYQVNHVATWFVAGIQVLAYAALYAWSNQK